MKALEILNRVLSFGNATDTEVKEAIAELGEMMKPKTCDTCKWENWHSEVNYCNLCERHPSRLVKSSIIKDYWKDKQ